jgi:hypothetical protein
MKKLAVIHFSAIELYPPVLNWLNYLCGQKNMPEVLVLTMTTPVLFESFPEACQNLTIKRNGTAHGAGTYRRYWSYLVYFITSFISLIRFKPDTILYYESLSALPAILYKKLINRHCRIFVHYHEYTSPEEYKNGMFIARFSHRLERDNYFSFIGISHTNDERLRLFSTDNKDCKLPSQYVFPNYPPLSWNRLYTGAKKPEGTPLKIVYVGALSIKTMYLEEFFSWIDAQKGKVILDIFSNNHDQQVLAMINSINSSCLNFKGGLNYFDLPAVLANYDVGAILYKGHIPNYIYNAPNKLFEYYASGLDVWLPVNMLGALPYLTKDVYPQILALDFEKLITIDPESLGRHSGLRQQSDSYTAENVYSGLYKVLQQHASVQ